MLITITKTFDDGTKRWVVGENPDVPKEVALRFIADGNATLGDSDVAPADSLGRPNDVRLTQHKRAPAPTAATNGAGVLTGTYYYRISFVTPDGETEAGVSTSVVCSSNQVRLTNIPVSTDNATSRRIWRSVTSGDQYRMFLLATLADNVTTTFDDNVADGSLGGAAPHINTTGGQIKLNAVGATSSGERVAIQVDETTTTIGYDSNPLGTAYNATAIGVVTLASLTTGLNNTGIGNGALNALTVGNNNTAVGYAALGGLSSASGSSSNTALGVSAGNLVTYGIENVFIGHSAFSGSSASNYAGNTVVGYQGYGSLGANVCSYNTAVGYRAGRLAFSANANYNVFIGSEAGSSTADSPAQSSSVSSSIAIGREATTNRSRQAVIGSADTTNGIIETQLQGQVRISYQDTTLAAPNAAAALQIDSTTRGLLLPRMTTAERDAISSPPAGLLIYNTSTNKLNFRAASAWEAVTSA